LNHIIFLFQNYTPMLYFCIYAPLPDCCALGHCLGWPYGKSGPVYNIRLEHISLGRAIAQAVSRRLPTAAARVQTRVWSCGIL
jgi:hypothetical protein